MDIAFNEAECARDMDEVPVGAVVVKDGQVIGRGHNQRESQQDPTAHAEIIALKMAAQTLGSWRLIDCELYVTLEPCPMCLGAAQLSRVKMVIYGAQDQKGGALSLGYPLHQDVRFNHRFEVHYRQDSRCEDILRTYFKNKRK